MSKHPINLAFRFFIELFTLIIFGFWGWQTQTDYLRYVFAVGLPLMAAVIWGTFRVPGDPGKALVPIPGFLRLIIEILLFTAATYSLCNINLQVVSWIFGGLVLVHYAISYDRVFSLLKH